MRKDFVRRNSLTYKIKFWLYRLTSDDVTRCAKTVGSCIIEFIMCALALGLLFLIPAFLH